MKASELVTQLRQQIAQHGDLEIMLDCDSILVEPEEVRHIHAVYLPRPLLVILPRAQDEVSN